VTAEVAEIWEKLPRPKSKVNLHENMQVMLFSATLAKEVEEFMLRLAPR
jgi:hypothetical protein